MRSLLRLRLRPELPVLTAILLAGLIASCSLLYRYEGLRSAPDRLVSAGGVTVLAILWLYRRSALAQERRESRMALLSALPISRSRLAWSRPLEILLPPAVLTVLFLGLAALGPVALGVSAESRPRVLLVLVASLVMLTDQLHLLRQELQARAIGFVLSALVWIGVPILVAGVATRFMLGRSTIRPALESLPAMVADGHGASVLLILTLVMAVINQQLFVRRHDFTI